MPMQLTASRDRGFFDVIAYGARGAADGHPVRRAQAVLLPSAVPFFYDRDDDAILYVQPTRTSLHAFMP